MHDIVDATSGAHHTHEHVHETKHTHMHSHTGEHSHTHEGLDPATVHTHEHTHTIMHDHDHAHEDEHTHTHPETDNTDRTEAVALLNYMIQHNAHHNAELLELKSQLEQLGLNSSAEQIDQSIADFTAGNEKLAAILESIQA